MDSQEALDELKHQVKCWREDTDFEYKIEPLEIAIEALEKQLESTLGKVLKVIVDRLEVKADVANDMILTEGKGLFFDGFEEGLREAINEIHIQQRKNTDEYQRQGRKHE